MATQVATGQTVLENSELRLELIGLKRWTVPMIEDSLRHHAPTEALLSHACAAVLREKLKFADASAIYYTTTIDGKPEKTYVAVTIVEPQDSGLIQYRGPFRHSLPARREWAPIRVVFEKHNIAFQTALQRPEFLSRDAPLSESDSSLAPMLPLRRFLRAHRALKDRQLALAALASDGNWENRVGGAALLVNFPVSDSTWWALANALRDPMGAVSSTAGQVLSTLTRGAPRAVNWAPATPALRAILDGTNLFEHNRLMEVLAATQIDTALARPLLKDGGYLVLAKLGSQGRAERQAAHRFLVQIAGRDLGDAPGAWREWITGL